MDNGLRLHFSKHAMQTFQIPQVSDDQTGIRMNRRAMSLAQVIKNNDLVSRSHQFIDTNRTDIPRPTCY